MKTRLRVAAGKFAVDCTEKELLERGVDQFDAALPIEHDDSKRTVLDQRIQVSGLFLKVKRNPVSLADRGTHDQSDSGDHQHQQARPSRERRPRAGTNAWPRRCRN